MELLIHMCLPIRKLVAAMKAIKEFHQLCVEADLMEADIGDFSVFKGVVRSER
jgi:hypothetical protein